MSNNFKTCHNTGTIKFVLKGKVKKTVRYISIPHRKEMMRIFNASRRWENYYMILMPD